MTLEQIIRYLEQTGWSKTPWGNYTREVAGKGADGKTHVKLMRVKMNKRSITIEMESATERAWFRFGGCSYDQLRMTTGGQMQALTFLFPS